MRERPRRSFLYAPADKPDLMEKTARTDADVAIFDLEDAVAPDRKANARDHLRTVTDGVDFGRKELCVRINGRPSDCWLDDLGAAIDTDVDIVRIPMVEAVRDVVTVVEAARQLSATPPEFHLALETPDGIFAGDGIARAARSIPEVTGISFGMGDYARAIGAPSTPERVREFLAHLVTGYASIGGLDPYFTVHTDVDDLEGLRESARLGYELGYVGQAAIHPKQVGIINDAYTPSEEFVEEARALIEEYDSVETDSIVIRGTFLDTAIVERYRSVVDRYDRIREMRA